MMIADVLTGMIIAGSGRIIGNPELPVNIHTIADSPAAQVNSFYNFWKHANRCRLAKAWSV